MEYVGRCEDVQPLWRTFRTGTGGGGQADQANPEWVVGGQADQANPGNNQPSDPIFDLMAVESDSEISIELDDYLSGSSLGEAYAYHSLSLRLREAEAESTALVWASRGGCPATRKLTCLFGISERNPVSDLKLTCTNRLTCVFHYMPSAHCHWHHEAEEMCSK